MKLRTFFECVKCFLIGNYKENDNGINDELHPSTYSHDMYSQNYGVPSPTLYTPPNEDIGISIEEEQKDGYTSLHANEGYVQEKITSKPNVKDINLNTDVFKSISELIVELDTVKQKLNSDETIQMLNFCQEKMIEALLSSGAQLLEKEESYSNTRHCPLPYGIYPNGIPIKRTIRPGVIVQNEIVLKALVEL